MLVQVGMKALDSIVRQKLGWKQKGISGSVVEYVPELTKTRVGEKLHQLSVENGV